ncbi:cytochrome P450 [Violaceomyces palustris]|uniref:Cytochrome P450 n=1 Tax=Violaceomyces palustris TaxID=1673888 RepID=A0ACD0P446_9BASI|nr:cytochrome P450 [Violaceomyces palustris]
MPSLPPTVSFDSLKVVAGLAFATHLLVQLAEPMVTHFLAAYLSVLFTYILFQSFSAGFPLSSSILGALLLATTYNVVIFSSIGVYRLFLHRACKFPGPASLALSKWAFVPSDAVGQRPQKTDELHKQYGDIVRVGPREISINDPTALPAIMGFSAPTIKGPWYYVAHTDNHPRSCSLHTCIDPALRKLRRKIWDPAFSIRALQEYENQIRTTTNETMDQLAARSEKNETIPVDQWAMYFAFDIMGQLGFSKGFGLVQLGTLSKPIHLLEEAMQAFMTLGCVSWLAPLTRLLPNPIKSFEDYCQEAVDERKMNGGKHADIMSYLLAEDKETGVKHTPEEIKADSGLIIVAGSDTSSSSLSMAIYLLLQHPECLRKAREEVDSIFEGQEVNDFEALKKCVYLTACLNEAMRLFPPVASGLQREIPSNSSPVVASLRNGEKVIIPPGMVVTFPTYSVHRDPRNFSPAPEKFRPERWVNPEKEIAFNKNAFLAFGHGPTSCIGKNLAWMEMRCFLASFIKRFDGKLDDSFDDAAFQAGIKDTFTMTRTKPLMVKLVERPASS